jgi:hypothetical protein
VRGDEPDSKDRTKFLKQFQAGDYHIGGSGGAMYGSGTYVGHAGSIDNGSGTFVPYSSKDAAKHAKRAVADLVSNGYVDKSKVVTRMALEPGANVVLQSQLMAERKQKISDFKAWQKQEIASRVAIAKKDPDFKKFDAARKKAEKAAASLKTAAASRVSTKSWNGGLRKKHTYAVSAGGVSVDFEISEEKAGRASLWRYQDTDGVWQSSSLGGAVNKAQEIAIKKFAANEALKNSGFTSAPQSPSEVKSATLKSTNEFAAVAGLNDVDSTSLGRYAVMRGYDAYILDDSYAPNTFAVMLNRSKVVVQADEHSYSTWKTKGAAA